MVVIGGGNTAVEEALFLTNFAKTVRLIHRRDELHAEKVIQERLFNHDKISVLWNHIVTHINGQENPKLVTAVEVQDTLDGTCSTINCDGVFVAIGHTPASELVIDQVETRLGGYVVTQPGSTQTSVRGVFAAGDLVDNVYRQAVTSAGMGCMAALNAEKYLAESLRH